MSFYNVLKNGDDMLREYPRRSIIWRILSYGTCLFTYGVSRMILSTLYNFKVFNFERLENAMKRSKAENRGVLTIMNHMSMVDDPFVWATFPIRFYSSVDRFRWCLGAENICFQNAALSYFFSLGKTLSTRRFGAGPFQDSIDATVRLFSTDETLLKDKDPNYKPPVRQKSPPWVHIYPEGFVLQLQPPHSNSMRYFRWGVARTILESTVPPIIVPIFSTGFEKIASEEAKGMMRQLMPRNYGSKIKVAIGEEISDEIIFRYRKEWQVLVEKYKDCNNPDEMPDELKYGEEAEDLRSRLAAELREHVAKIRHDECHFPEEDPRFKSVSWWKKFNCSEGESDPDVKIIGKNWAIKRLQTHLKNNENTKDH